MIFRETPFLILETLFSYLFEIREKRKDADPRL